MKEVYIQYSFYINVGTNFTNVLCFSYQWNIRYAKKNMYNWISAIFFIDFSINVARHSSIYLLFRH